MGHAKQQLFGCPLTGPCVQVAVPAAEDKGVPAGRVFVGGHSMGGGCDNETLASTTAAVLRLPAQV